MTISSATRTAGPFTGTGLSVAYPFGFKAFTTADLAVVKTDASGVLTTLTLSADYAVTLNADQNSAPGGSVTLVVALPVGYSLTISTAVVATQGASLTNGGAFFAQVIENALDRVTVLIQQILSGVSRLTGVLQFPYGDTASGQLPSAATRAGYLLAFDSSGNPTTAAPVSGSAAAVTTDLINTSTVAKGDALIGVKRTFSGAVATTEHAWHEAQVIDFVADMLADSTGAVDCTAKFQTAITAGNVRVGPGTYTMSWTAISADITIPANRKITIDKGATITMTGGRFVADNASNVEWEINGWVKSVTMRAAAGKTLWTALPLDRGFIEFGFNYVAGTAGSGFWVHGSGKVSGDWTGTPNQTDLANQVNKKGIACWNAKDVLVEGLEVFGFEGEAIYAAFFDTASKDIVFQNNYSHDNRFNGLNFNAAANGGACYIRNNFVANCFQAIEISAGECSGNYITTMVSHGVNTGQGAGLGPLTISRNIINNVGTATVVTSHGIVCSFASISPVTGVEIADNAITSCSGYGIYADYIREFSIRGNKCIGIGSAFGSYDIGIFHALRGTVTENTFLVPGALSAGHVVADQATCFDVSVDPTTNIYLPTTGSAAPKTGNGTQALASAAALLLPSIGSIFTVSGVTTITSIAADNTFKSNWDGRQITLIFLGILTLTDGSNLKLAGNFVTTADDTITLVCDGASWYEVGRSVN